MHDEIRCHVVDETKKEKKKKHSLLLFLLVLCLLHQHPTTSPIATPIHSSPPNTLIQSIISKHNQSQNTRMHAMHLPRGELGDGLGAFRDGVLGEFTGEDEADGGLDLTRGDSGLLVVSGQVLGLGGDLVKDIIDEGVHDGHGLGGDTCIGVHLLEDLVDVDLVRLGLALGPLLLLVALHLGLLGRLGGGLLVRLGLLLGLGRHLCGWAGV